MNRKLQFLLTALLLMVGVTSAVHPFFSAKQKKLKLFAQSSFFCNFVSNKRKSNKKT